MKNRSVKIICLIAIMSVLLSISGCYSYFPIKIPFKIPGVIQGSGNIVTESRSVSNFNRISMSWVGNLIITQGEEESLTVKAENNIMQYIITEVRDDTLYLGFDTEKYKIILPGKPVEYNLKLKNIVGLNVSGSGNIESDSIETDSIDFNLSGLTNVNIRMLKAERLNIKISGSSNVGLIGKVNEQDIKISGSGSYDAGDLFSKKVNLKVSGSGKTTIWATESLDVNISGSGTVEYYGNPTIRSSISGSGKINSLGEK